MQTRTYGDLFKTASALIGTGGELSAGEQSQLGYFINRRFQQAFDESPVWPRYFVPSEERSLALYKLSGGDVLTSTLVNQNFKFEGLAEDGTASIGGTKVYSGFTTSNTLIYKNNSNAWVVATNVTTSTSSSGIVGFGDAGTVQYTEADAVKNDSIEDVKIWTPRGGVSQLKVLTQSLIPYAETGKDSIGDFNRIHRNRAFLNNSSLEYDFFVDFDGANILNISSSTATSAFVSYKKQFTPFTVTSDYYNSTAEVPGEFFNFIAHAVYADFLRVQNRQEEALAEEQVAQTYLALELEKIDLRSNNNTINHKFSTYVNRQSR
jgi:hypothetical protein